MAKKRRRKKKKDKKLVSKKKMRKYLFRLFLLAAVAAAVVIAKPDLIPDPAQRTQVKTLRRQILQANDEAQEQAMDVLKLSSEKAKDSLGTVSDITKEVTNTDPEAFVKEKVETLTEEVKTLPEKQVKRIKREFCADVIEEEIDLVCEEDN